MGVFLGMSIFGHAKHLCKFMPFLTSFLVRLFMKIFCICSYIGCCTVFLFQAFSVFTGLLVFSNPQYAEYFLS